MKNKNPTMLEIFNNINDRMKETDIKNKIIVKKSQALGFSCTLDFGSFSMASFSTLSPVPKELNKINNG